MVLEKKYEVVDNAPPAMSWGDYEGFIRTKFQSLLQTDASNEKIF